MKQKPKHWFLLILNLLIVPCHAQITVQFIDVTTEAGITFKHINGASDRKFYLETMGSGAAFLDYDNDGDLDLYIVNGAPLPGFETDYSTHEHPLSKRRGRGVRRCHCGGRSGRHRLRYGLRRRRLRQRRRLRSVRDQFRGKSFVQEQWGWHIHRCDDSRRGRKRAKMEFKLRLRGLRP